MTTTIRKQPKLLIILLKTDEIAREIDMIDCLKNDMKEQITCLFINYLV